MASIEGKKQNITCPICHEADQVKTLQAAYESGVEKCAPPDMPMKSVPMLKYILFSAIMVGICIFLILVLVGSEASMGAVLETVLVSITLICIVAALVISYIAFQRVVKGDAEMTVRFPAWDRAMGIWRALRYCSRNDIVFNPATNQVVSDSELAKLRSMEDEQAAIESAATA